MYMYSDLTKEKEWPTIMIKHLPMCSAGINPGFERSFCHKPSQLTIIYSISLFKMR